MSAMEHWVDASGIHGPVGFDAREVVSVEREQAFDGYGKPRAELCSVGLKSGRGVQVMGTYRDVMKAIRDAYPAKGCGA